MADIKKIQAVLLNIFKVFADICEKNNLRYIAVSATCIGAVRHKGFVPWDGDLDVAMPSGDVLRFTEIAKSQLPDYLTLVTRGNTIPRLCDVRTTVLSKAQERYPDTYMGIYIDIIPIAGVPAGMERRFTLMCYGAVTLNWRKEIPVLYLRDWTGRVNKNWLMTVPLKPFLFFIPRRFFAYLKKKLYDKYDFDKYGQGRIMTVKKQHLGVIIKKEDFEEYIYLDFEDTKIRCPKNYDKILTQLYGDYMTLPAHRRTKEQQEADIYTYFIDFNRSYRDYQKTGELLPKRARKRYLKSKK